MMIPKQKLEGALGLIPQAPCTREELCFDTADQNRPGLQFSGYFNHFPNDRMQIMGRAEMTYLDTLEPDERKARLTKYFTYVMPCLVICRDLPCPDDFAELATYRDIPVYGSSMVTSRFQALATQFLSRALAPRQTMHGVLVDVHGVGVLLTGDSGVGKSEAALELVKRGHQLVADDVVDIVRVAETRLTGEAPERVRYYMEIRGIGIIDVRAMFGVGSVVQQKSIDIVMHLEHWVREREYDRLGLSEETTDILGVKVPRILMPVRPGRNLAIVIEVAAKNYRLRRMGINAAAELDAKLLQMFSKGET